MALPTASEILSFYLFGTQTPPSSKDSDSLIRPSGLVQTYPIEILGSEFMGLAGPGRFANPATLGLATGELKITDHFFRGELGLGPGRYTLDEIIAAAGGAQQVTYGVISADFVDPLNDDYNYRSFIWNSIGVRIDPNSIFVIDQNGSMRIENFALIPVLDNFDFESNTLSSEIFNELFEGWFDPSGLGRAVTFELVDDIQRRVYTYDDYIADFNSSLDLHSPVGVLDAASVSFIVEKFANEMWDADVTNFVERDRLIAYGSDGADTIHPSTYFTGELFQYARHRLSDYSGYLVFGGAGNDEVHGWVGSDILYGGSGADRFYGAAGDDTIYGDSSDLVFDGGFGFDIVDLSDADSAVVWNSSVVTITGIERVLGSEHDDVFDLNLVSGSLLDHLLPPKMEIYGRGGDDRIVGGELGDFIHGGNGDDTIVGGSGDDTLLGGAGDDRIEGDNDGPFTPDGSDDISGGDGDDIIDGQGGDDTIRGDSGNDRILGGDGEDRIYGGGGRDILIGGADADEIHGGAGDDILDAAQQDGSALNPLDGSSSDSLWGGAGADIFLTNDGDVIRDPDTGDRVKLDEEWLRGGRETEEGSGVYVSSTGTRYQIEGSTLTVSTSGFLGFGSSTITIENFTNGLAGIRLLPPEPDTDEAEERRDPLIIDLDGNRNVITNRTISNAYFDLDNDGFAEKVAWSTAGDGFLVRDLNGNGLIDDGSEMFGTGHTDLDAGSLDRFGDVGFFELASLDSNLDGFISAADVQFDTLRVWIDANLDAVTDEGELLTLAELGIVSIGVIGGDHDHVDFTGDDSVITGGSTVLFDDGSTRSVYDAYLSIDQYDARENVDPDLDLSAVADLPNLLGTGTVSDLHVAMSRDPALEEMVRGLAELTADRAHEIGARVEAILMRWTGADQADADGRGPNIDGQVLHALEQITGKGFNQAAIGPDPRGDAASLLTANWNEIVQRTTAKLLGQLDLGAQLLPGMQFAAGAFFVVDEGTTLASVLDAVATAAPSDPNLAVKHWATAIAVIAQYNAGLGMTDEEIFSEIDASGVLSGLPLSASQLAQIVTANSASGVAIGTDRFAERVEGNDVLFADRSGVELRGRSRDDTYVIASDASGVTIRDTHGTDRLVLLGQTFGDLTVTAGFDDAEFRPANEASLLALPITITLENAATGWNFSWSLLVRDGSVQSEIDDIEFGDGTTMSVTDLVSGIEIPAPDFGIYVLEQGVLAPAGTAGGDFYFGGNSGDRFVFGGQGDDRFVETDRDGADGDVLIINALLSEVQIEFAADGADLLIRTASGSARIVGQFARAGGIERLQFADGSEMLVADVQRQLTTGSTGDDHIFGSAAADLIDGAGGTDLVEGGYGADSYVFGRGYGSLTIVDGLGGNNIDFSDFDKSEVSVVRRSNGVVLDLGNGDSVTLSGSSNNFELRFADGAVTVAGLLLEQGIGGSGPSDGVIYGSPFSDYWLVGTDGNDVISSGTGLDYLSGDLGDDTYVFSPGAMIDIYDAGGFDIISIDASLSFDQVIVYDGGIRFEGDDGYIRPNNYLDSNGVPYGDPEFIEALVFADGRTLDLTRGYNPVGSASDDILYDFSSNQVTFRPGAGNDRIFTYGTYAEKTVVLEQGFGHDVFYSSDSFQIDLTAFVLDDRVGFARRGDDLVITTDGGENSFTLHDGFGPFSTRSSGNRFDGSLFHFSDGISLSVTDIAMRISIASDGDDQLFFQTVLDGGAGNDTLYGDSNANEYRFGRGYGHDVIKDEGRGSQLVDRFGNDLTDVLVLDGLNRADVSFARSQSDPTSIVITILDTGETLTIDGTPFDGYTFIEPYPSPVGKNIDTGISNVIETIRFADGTTLSQAEVEQELIAAEATSGNDRIVSFGDLVNSTGGYHLDAGDGDDTYVTRAEQIAVILRAGGGSDRIEFAAGDYLPKVDVRLEGLDLADLTLDLEQRDGRIWTILRARDGTSLEFEGNLGAFQLLTIEDESGTALTPWQYGPLVAGSTATEGEDFLRGQVIGTFTTSSSRPTPVNDIFDGGAGNDVIAGFAGQDIVRFGRGDGVDTLLDSRPLGSSRNLTQSYVIEFESGISQADIEFEWLSDGSGRIAVVISGTSDRLIMSPNNLAELVFADGTRVATSQLDILASRPAATSGDDVLFSAAGEVLQASAGNDTIYALYDRFGSTSIEFGAGSGNDTFSNQTGPANTGDRFWSTGGTNHQIVLTNINSLEELAFSQAEDDPNDLIIEIIATGETLRVVGQFRKDMSGYDSWVVSGLVMADGTQHWWGDVLPRLNRSEQPGGDDQTIATGPEGGLLSGGIGNDTLQGGTGTDSYILGRGFDEDVIQDAGGIDTLLFDEGIAQPDVFFSRIGGNGDDLLIEIQGEERLTMTISGQFADGGTGRVEFFRFADGSALDWSDVQEFIVANSPTSRDDTIAGFSSSDDIAALSGNDTIEGAGGNDYIDGGSGRDTAIFSGASSEYAVETIDGITTVTDLIVDRDGTDHLVNIEDIYFTGDDALVNLVAPNSAPVVQDGTASTSEDSDLVIARSELLALASDADGDVLQLSVGAGVNGRAWIDLDGNVRFRPDRDFTGEAGFEFSFNDGNGDTSSASYSVVVTALNDAPRALDRAEDLVFFEDEAVLVSVPDGLFVDPDGDAFALSLTLADGSSLPDWLSFDGTVISGQPPANFYGEIELTLVADDGQARTLQTFSLNFIPRNDAPEFVGSTLDCEVRPGSNISLAIGAELFTDAEGDPVTLDILQASGEALPTWLTYEDGILTGSVPAEFEGPLNLVVISSDGQSSSATYFALSAPDNLPPVAEDDGVFVGVQAQDLVILAADLLANDSDADGDVLSIIGVSTDGPGTVSLDADGNIVFSIDSTYVGVETFSYTVSDGFETSTATVNVRIDSRFNGWSVGTSSDERLFGNHNETNAIDGLGGDDMIKGGKLDDMLSGGAGDDHIIALAGNDHLWGGAGNDLLNGNGGFDTAHYFGQRSTYQIRTVDGTVQVVDTDATRDGDDGTDTISSIEMLSFRNGETASVVSPIILDLDGDGVETVSASDSRARFDLDGDGRRDDTSWIGSGDGFLYLDRNGDGTMSGVEEISFIDDVENAASDLAGLAAYDSNGDGVLDADDERFSEFGVWRDADGDGRVDDGETLTLPELGIASIGLAGTAVNGTSEFGEVAIVNTGSYTLDSGETREFADAALTYFSAANSRPALRFSLCACREDFHEFYYDLSDSIPRNMALLGDWFGFSPRLLDRREAVFDLLRERRDAELWDLCEPERPEIGLPPSAAIAEPAQDDVGTVSSSPFRAFDWSPSRDTLEMAWSRDSLWSVGLTGPLRFADFVAKSDSELLRVPEVVGVERRGWCVLPKGDGGIDPAGMDQDAVARRVAMIRQDLSVFGLREHEESLLVRSPQSEVYEFYA